MKSTLFLKFIALAGDKEEYILNGDRVIIPYPINISYGAVSFEYTGTNLNREKITTSYSKPLQRDLIVEVNIVQCSE